MKKYLILFLIPLLFSCSPTKQKIVIAIENPVPIERMGAIVTISRADLVKHMGKLSNKDTLLVIWQGNPMTSQIDDLDGDGDWDELAFQCDLLPSNIMTMVISRPQEGLSMKFVPKTNIRFARIIKPGVEYEEADSATRLSGFMTDSTKKYPQFEGPGWENELIAFRNYFDERNGIDIFGKITSQLILDGVGITEDYHEPLYWGMDILKVNNSLGAGAIAIYYKDTLYRVSAIEGAGFHKVVEGPVRSILDLDFKKLQIGDLTLSLKHRITIVAGEFGYRSDVTIYNQPEDVYLVSGIVNLHSDTLYAEPTKSSRIFYTHDKQTMLNEYLGMGVLTRSDEYIDWFETPKEGEGITNTYAIKMKPYRKDETTFRFYAGWAETRRKFMEREAFRKYMLREAELIENPVKVIFQ